MTSFGLPVVEIKAAGLDIVRVRAAGTDVWTSGVLVPDPISWFDWHEGSGTTTVSLISAAHQMVAVTPASAWSGTAANGQFNGNIGDADEDTTNWTIGIGFTLDPSPSGANVIMVTGVVSSPNDIYFQLIDDDLEIWTGNGAGSSGFSPAQPTNLAAGAHLLVVTSDATENDTSIYLDGIFKTSRTGTAVVVPDDVNVHPDTWPLDGVVESVRYWDVPLTAAQIATL